MSHRIGDPLQDAPLIHTTICGALFLTCTSNELGAFESGMAAALIGATGAVVTGGLGTLVAVVAVAYLWPEFRRLGRLAPEDG
jgi:hypothetical protein